MLTLVGCGGNTGLSNEELIKSDIEAVLGTIVSTDELAAEVKSDSGTSSYTSYGLDVDAVFSKFSWVIQGRS